VSAINTATTAARVCVLGPSGRMGKSIVDAAASQRAAVIATLLDRADSPIVGSKIAGIEVTANVNAGLSAANVYIDFTTPASTRVLAEAAALKRIAGVIGTTGLSADDDAAIARLATVAPVVVAANFSLGVNLLLGVAQQVARALGSEWDAEVSETHHRAKRDAPSGTALAIARAIAAGHQVNYDDVKRHSRDGDIGPRPQGEIGVATLRGGDVVGEHTASFFGMGERLEITHRATSRAIFAAGALRAAAWVVGKPPGRYDMIDVLGLRG
jgi:4-hydroxy-tetrahydrodipicolinate reductase